MQVLTGPGLVIAGLAISVMFRGGLMCCWKDFPQACKGGKGDE
jgi:hypothetical protein